MKRMILLKYLKELDADLKIILDHQNNYRSLKLIVRMLKVFAVLSSTFKCPVIIFMIQQNYFQICIWLNF